MKRTAGDVLRLLASFGVILGWFLVMTWVVVSVTQIAVERTFFAPCAVAAPSEAPC